MPQIFQVLRCYKCLVFQVHQTKKSNKWECKLCGEKQSVKRHYGIGTAKDCRIHVQKLNSMRGEKDESKYDQKLQNQSEDSDEIENIEQENVCCPPKKAFTSKWANYVEERTAIEEVDNKPEYLGDAEVVLEIPKKRRKQFNAPESKSNSAAATLNVDQESHRNSLEKLYNKAQQKTMDYSNKKTYKPPCYKTGEKEMINITDVKPIQGSPSECFQSDISKSYIQNENFKPDIPCKKIIQPVVNKNSKWAEYVEDERDEESSDFSASQNDYLFSQCDDSELDSVLDI